MPAYFIAEIELTNSAEYEPYRTAVPATMPAAITSAFVGPWR